MRTTVPEVLPEVLYYARASGIYHRDLKIQHVQYMSGADCLIMLGSRFPPVESLGPVQYSNIWDVSSVHTLVYRRG